MASRRGCHFSITASSSSPWRWATATRLVGGDTKRVLRRAMYGILPERVRTRRDKLGFATPEEAWFRGPLREAVLGGVEDTLRRYRGLMNERGVRAHAAAMLDGTPACRFLDLADHQSWHLGPQIRGLSVRWGIELLEFANLILLRGQGVGSPDCRLHHADPAGGR